MFRSSLVLGVVLVLAAAGSARAALADDPGDSVNSRTYYSDEPSSETTRVNKYGAGFRMRWVTVPGWFLGMFTEKNVPLSTYGYAVELFQRRKGDLDIVLGVGYQNMSPPDGNWLGKNHDPSVDTDFVHFNGLGFIGVDLSFVWRSELTKFFGMHWGAGIGVAFVQGEMWRVSNSGACTMANASDVGACHPAASDWPTTAAGRDAWMKNHMGAEANDTAQTPTPFKDSNIPSVLPIVNLLVGMHFRIPSVKGLELRIDGGFYDAFFVGGAMSYAY